jgi:hypothetical protein
MFSLRGMEIASFYLCYGQQNFTISRFAFCYLKCIQCGMWFILMWLSSDFPSGQWREITFHLLALSHTKQIFIAAANNTLVIFKVVRHSFNRF